MVVHLDNISVKFEYPGHWVKVKVISWKMLILLLGHQFNLSEIKVIQRSNCKCFTFYQQEVGGSSTEKHSY